MQHLKEKPGLCLVQYLNSTLQCEGPCVPTCWHYFLRQEPYLIRGSVPSGLSCAAVGFQALFWTGQLMKADLLLSAVLWPCKTRVHLKLLTTTARRARVQTCLRSFTRGGGLEEHCRECSQSTGVQWSMLIKLTSIWNALGSYGMYSILSTHHILGFGAFLRRTGVKYHSCFWSSSYNHELHLVQCIRTHLFVASPSLLKLHNTNRTKSGCNILFPSRVFEYFGNDSSLGWADFCQFLHS